jgi:predicted small metal-binding protein
MSHCWDRSPASSLRLPAGLLSINLCKIALNSYKKLSKLPEPPLGMGKIIECNKVDPSSGCTHIVRGKTDEEVLRNAAEHAKTHGIREITPELMQKVRLAIREE